jgi:hypothetical protein
MEQPNFVVSAPGVRQRHRRRHSRVPLDTVFFLLFFGALLPLGISAGWFHPEGRLVRAGEGVLLGLALAFGLSGAILLGIARYPLYTRKHHHSFRPRELPEKFRRLFWVAYVLVMISAIVLLYLGIVQRCF